MEKLPATTNLVLYRTYTLSTRLLIFIFLIDSITCLFIPLTLLPLRYLSAPVLTPDPIPIYRNWIDCSKPLTVN